MRYYDLLVRGYGPPKSPKPVSPKAALSRTSPTKTVPSKVAAPSTGPGSAPSTMPTHLTIKAPKTALRFGSYYKTSLGGGLTVGGPLDSFDPGALDISFSFSVAPLDKNVAPHFTVKGVDITTVQQVGKLVGKYLTFRGGMGRGMPLSLPQTSGQILFGVIAKATGTWDETGTALDFFLSNPLDKDGQREITFSVKKGHKLQQAICSALKKAYTPPPAETPKSKGTPRKATQDGATPYTPPLFYVSKDPVMSKDDNIQSKSLTEFAKHIADLTRNPDDKEDKGWVLTVDQNGVLVFSDGKTPRGEVKTVQAWELIGSPVLSGPKEMSFTTALRADIATNDAVTLAGDVWDSALHLSPNPYAPDPQAPSGPGWMITQTDYTGSFRNTDGKKWACTFHCRLLDLPLPENPVLVGGLY